MVEKFGTRCPKDHHQPALFLATLFSQWDPPCQKAKAWGQLQDQQQVWYTTAMRLQVRVPVFPTLQPIFPAQRHQVRIPWHQLKHLLPLMLTAATMSLLKFCSTFSDSWMLFSRYKKNIPGSICLKYSWAFGLLSVQHGYHLQASYRQWEGREVMLAWAGLLSSNVLRFHWGGGGGGRCAAQDMSSQQLWHKQFSVVGCVNRVRVFPPSVFTHWWASV